MNNRDNYKKAIDQIHASDELKEKTLNLIKEKNKVKKIYPKILASCAMFLVVVVLGNHYFQEKNIEIENIIENPSVDTEYQIATIDNDLPRFKDIEQLKEVLKENTNNYRNEFIGIYDLASDSATNFEESSKETINSTQAVASESQNKNFSTTNVQVENVDEADIVKTDGDYIYYVTNSVVYIVKADSLEIFAKINWDNDEKVRFNPSEIYINGNKLIILGNSYEIYETLSKTTSNSIVSVTDVARINSKNTAKAIVYDISNKTNPIITRKIELDGYYSNSRMIGENIYFISSKAAYYYEDMPMNDILPIYKDTALSREVQKINCTDIAYFEGTESRSFTLVAGFNINNDEQMSLETFFGASNTVYASQENLYLAQVKYENGWKDTKNTIYKFKLEDSKIILQCKGEVKGNLNNQFSLDEYEGNLRIATTSYVNDETSNNIYILNKKLEKIGKIENLAPGEDIYSVRFIGKIGYVVTFEQIDPLFVIDLSNPTNPEVKGELKIPGYSSYLHPYDETHIIGIGHNTRDNGYGGVTNAGLKMSMFDVSDLENPKEIFNVTIGEYYAYSDITYNHKVLFFNKSENLIGFPVTYKDFRKDKYTDSFICFRIDLEKGFEKYGEILEENRNYEYNIERVIYIENQIFTLTRKRIISYDLNTTEKLKEVVLEN